MLPVLIRAFYLLLTRPTAHGAAFVPHYSHLILSSLSSSYHDYHQFFIIIIHHDLLLSPPRGTFEFPIISLFIMTF